jgi:hypothetical protein
VLHVITTVGTNQPSMAMHKDATAMVVQMDKCVAHEASVEVTSLSRCT